MVFVYLLFGVLLVGTSATWTCKNDEVPCVTSNGTCILGEQWCDDEIDCPDGSDELYCKLGNCLQDQFLCKNKRCIPLVAVCDGYDNCGDGSDEECGSTRESTAHSKSQLAVVEATHYLLSQRKSDYGWDDFTPRALIALAFAEKYLPISEKEKDLMMKRQDLQLLLLLRNGIKNLATLALHINALYAMCKDPRDFHGIDLVNLLRSETDKAMKSDLNIPIVFLTLCLAKETTNVDQLIKIYGSSDRIGVKALTVIAMALCTRQTGIPNFRFEMQNRDFVDRYNVNDRNIDVYTKALIYQAYNALGYNTSPFHHELLELQSESGSFGDLLGTYSVIPVLLNTSLANLQCKTRNYEAKLARLSFATIDRMFEPERHVEYSLSILDGENAGIHSLKIAFEGHRSLYDLMKVAELRNPMYRFKFDEVREIGKKVYYLAGIPNDAEKGSTWQLYEKTAVNSAQDMHKRTDGVDQIFPQDGDHFIFQLEH